MTNNNHRTKSKRIQCKDVSTLAILRFVAEFTDRGSSVTTFRLEDEPRSIWNVMLPVIPMCVMRQKFENTVRKGLIQGCYCGCRGDFIITEKGRERIKLLEEAQARLAKEFLEMLYDVAPPGSLNARGVAASVSYAIEDLISKSQLTAIDVLLEHVDFTQLNTRVSLSLVRTPSRLKERLTNWQHALLRFDQHLQLKYPLKRDSLMAGLHPLLPNSNHD